MQMTGAKILMECLLEQGVDTVFGYPGGTILNVYDELYRYRGKIRHILTSHEQGASHAADGYARSTGKVGVCFATSGPGCTNLTTGIATAYMDSSPVVFITCNVAENLVGKDSFQEVDITGITMPITKCNYMVRDTAKLADIVREAFAIARGGRPGPVLIDIVKNATAQTAEFIPLPREAHASAGRLGALIKRASHDLRAPEPDLNDVHKLVHMIQASQKPLLICGGGVVRSRADHEFLALAECIDAPVAVTVMGGGGFKGRNPLTTGMIGMHGTKTSNFGVTECDLLIVVGARFSDRVIGNATKFARNAKILQFDIDPVEINKNIKTDAHIIGDIQMILRRLNARLDPVNHDEWLAHIDRMKDMYPLRYDKDVLSGPYVIEKLYEVTDGDAVISTDVGQHQMWTAQYYKFKQPRQLLTSGGLGTMGYGLGACIGAKMGVPDKTVINIAGDGCFRMNMNEIATAVRYNIPIIQIVLNNHVLGMVRQWQTLFYGKRYSHTVLNDKMDFVKVAEGMGARAYRVTSKEELEPVLREAIEADEPVVIDCQIHCDDKVFPMVSPGAPIEDAFDANDLKI